MLRLVRQDGQLVHLTPGNDRQVVATKDCPAFNAKSAASSDVFWSFSTATYSFTSATTFGASDTVRNDHTARTNSWIKAASVSTDRFEVPCASGTSFKKSAVKFCTAPGAFLVLLVSVL